MQQIRRNLELLAQTDLPLLLQGESGTGKGVVADLLHQQTRVPGRMVTLSCVSQNETSAVLQQLLGGAQDLPARHRTGFAALLPEGGTVVLDDIHELDLHLQAKLLIMLRQQDVSSSSARSPIRIISTSTRDLQTYVDERKFRIDLLYRVNAVKVLLPPLRERAEDIRGFAEFFLQKYARESMGQRPRLSEEALQMMEGYHWPGNIRQVDNLLRNFVLMRSEEAITKELLQAPAEVLPDRALDQIDVSRPIALKELTRQVTQDLERQIIFKVLRANGWNRQKTAKWLSISYRSLLYKLSDFGATEEERARLQSIRARELRAANY